MTKSIEELLPEKPEARLRIYAYSIEDDAHAGLLKIGQTTNDVKTRVEQQLKTAAIKNFTIHLDEAAERVDGSTFTDHQVRARLKAKGFANPELEWMRCTVADVQTAITELRTGQVLTGSHHETFAMRPEQAAAVDKTYAYYQSIWDEDADTVPRFLWNAKMRFGKTFAAYQLAKKLGAVKVLVVTFKPAVEDAWQHDLESHADFDGWQYLSKATGKDPTTADPSKPIVYFGSFQDLLGKDKSGNIKPKNEWLHETNWDLVIFDEYHFGAWRDRAKELFEGEDEAEAKKEAAAEYNTELDTFNEELDELGGTELEFLPITTGAYLYLSGTPFKALATGEFIEEQIFNWTYSDEQRAKQQWAKDHPDAWNPYGALPEMRLLTYQMPDELLAIASQGEFDEFDLNEFFAAIGDGHAAEFKYKGDVQKWLNIIRGAYSPTQIDNLKLGGKKPPFPYSDVRLLPYMNHSFWFLPSVAACQAMANLLAEKQNVFYHEYTVLTVAGPGAGVGLAALPPVREAIGNGHDSKTITLSCGKLTTGVTVPQWSSILMLRNLNSPETYFQAAFRVQSPWSIKNPDGDDPNLEENLKPACFVFDFAPTRALRQMAEYGIGLSPEVPNPEDAVKDLVSFLPVLAYDGSNMTQVDAGGILDIAMAGTSATLLARKWESALLVNVDNDTLRKILDNPAAFDAVMRIEGFRALGSDIFETVINKSEKVKATKKAKGEDISAKEKRELTAEEKEYKSKRKLIQEKLIKFATRIPAFMYLTDFRENTLKDVITKLEPGLFKAVTGLTVDDFNLLVSLNVFNSTHMNQAVFAFRRYEDSSLSYTGIDSHEGLSHLGLYDTVVAREA
ncbi:T5orf172 domain [Mycobacteroides abscessus subsp. abscessus]|uniref:T5orf172 domain n=1 Tax=Mycobacteroides abscessus TaxID=36809 RepID=A0AB33TA58_9MYCO|nr:DEAD/DEAH box helicase family protein [Mycobacteroides abscessus]MDO3017401.1 GIY-YIG nuclease family protein [Mycobacteroides abscessus subsp. abscessus]MDO3083405.1 GIY-YIG nuclease family protein [Mycobacteroides abscessus subsp. abscessus]PVB18036.1 restriction endonuclease [Mycobacteroides abscessus]RIR96900.1 restriction endonuclease [Mycobacteroides abscessus]CPT43001.1 T5orf172 domain [Mycobacteroides abscessus]